MRCEDLNWVEVASESIGQLSEYLNKLSVSIRGEKFLD
jgi:hypothetical protein